MYDISCSMCLDLLPLVRDGVASDESREAVERHLAACPACAAHGEGMPASAPPRAAAQTFRSLRRRVRVFVAFALLLCIFAGVQLTASADMFYNSLLMPVIGAMGYVVLRKRAFWQVPLFILAVHGAAELVKGLRGEEALGVPDLFVWAALYSLFALAGALTALLLGKAFGKRGKSSGKCRKVVSLVTAGCLIAGIVLFANALVGNPVSYLLARDGAQKRLGEAYAGSDYGLERVSYSFKTGNYLAYISAPGSADRHFTLWIDGLGRVQRDDFQQLVEEGENTARRLDMAYRALTDAVLESPSFPYTCPIAFGELEFLPRDTAPGESAAGRGIPMRELVPDGIYDIPALGARAGRLTVYAEDETVSAARAAEHLLELRRLMDAGGAPFYAIDFVLESPRTGNETRPEGRVEVQSFPYADIRAEGLTARVEAADRQARARDAAAEKE